MKFLKHISDKKILIPAILSVFVMFLASTHITHASFFGLDDITGGFVSGLAWIASTLIAGILGIVVAVEMWFVAIVLNINDGVFQSTFVQTGFSISLSVANLAFVLGIIVIAIATILRNESYGIKKLLWKLVVAAILVNFGLVIAAPIFGLGNSLTHYFLNCIDPTGGGCTASSSGFDSYSKFATSFAGTFQPQDNFTTVNTAAATAGNSAGVSAATGAFSALGTVFGKTFVPIFGVFATVVNLVIIIAVLLAFILLLLIRYLYIAILAILMPFAWASWVFPGFKTHWDSWWNQFIRWTFFSPVVIFFIYLAMLLMQPSASGGMDFTPYFSSSTALGGAFAPLSALLGSLFTPIIEASLREIIFAGLIVGGMIAANSMGIKMAGTAVGVMKQGGAAVGNWSKKQGVKGARRGWQAAGGQNLTRRLQSGQIGKFANVPGAKRLASLAGRGLSSIQTNQALVEASQKNVPKGKEEVLANLSGSMNKQDTFAHLAAAIKGGYLTEETMVNGKKARDIVDDKDAIQRYGQGGLAADADDLFLSNTDIRNCQRALKDYSAALEKGVSQVEAQKLLQVPVSAKDGIKDSNGNVIQGHKQGDLVDATTLLRESMDELILTKKKGDLAKVNMKDVFGKKTTPEDIDIQNVRLGSIARQTPEVLPTIMNKLRGSELKNIQTIYPKIVDAQTIWVGGQIEKIANRSDIDDEQKAAEISRLGLDRAQKNLEGAAEKFEKVLVNNSTFVSFTDPAGGSAPEPTK
ncbi:MAG: hypothetical protein P4L67_01420 [Candidatus Pacebacteria bacterium]|nr:hypothetical protein [Candidatus Paceibacterota bacterium]